MTSYKIDEKFFPHIEKALNIKLYDWQKEYLKSSNWHYGLYIKGRRNGRTMAYCVKIALTDGEPLDVESIIGLADYGDTNYSNLFFKNYFLDIYFKLKFYGFKVRELKEPME